MTKHTPTPWSVQTNSAVHYPIVDAMRVDGVQVQTIVAPAFSFAFGQSVALTIGDNVEANAAHIVLCVNAHSALVSALQAYRDAYDIDPRDRANDGMAKWCEIQDAAVAALIAAGVADEDEVRPNGQVAT